MSNVVNSGVKRREYFAIAVTHVPPVLQQEFHVPAQKVYAELVLAKNEVPPATKAKRHLVRKVQQLPNRKSIYWNCKVKLCKNFVHMLVIHSL
jgi:hypothetical protein